MKNILTWTIVSASLVFASCTKKETIIQQYNPPGATLYGAWKIVNTNPLDSTKSYLVFPNDGTNFFAQMSEDKWGFRSMGSEGVFNATDKQLIIASGGLFNYRVAGDSLILSQSSTSKIVLLKATDPSVNMASFVTRAKVEKSHPVYGSMTGHAYSFGINGDTLYFMSNVMGGGRLYKYLSSTGQVIDSVGAVLGCAYWKAPSTMYLGFNNTNSVWKGGNMTAFAPNSTNTMTNVTALSVNPTFNTIFAYQADGKMFSGADGGAYNPLYNFSPMGAQMVCFYSGETYLLMRGNYIHKVKISPSFSVVKSYRIPDHSITAIATNGTETWAASYNTQLAKYQFIKLNLPD